MMPGMPEQPNKWIFDTVVVSNFIFSDALSLLKKRYRSKGIITSEVHGELLAGVGKYPNLTQVNRLFVDKIFELKYLSEKERAACEQLLSFLGLGEASTIVYAHNHNGVVVTDDQAARNQCKRINIPVTGTIGILKACALNTLVTIEEADDILRKMMLAGFYSPVKSMKDIILNP